MKIKLKRLFKKAAKNKKGFSLVEAIAVVAIMGVLAVTIGSLVGSATTSYMREKDKADAIGISNIITKEIERQIYNAKEIFLQRGVDIKESWIDDEGVSHTSEKYTSSLPTAEGSDGTGYSVKIGDGTTTRKLVIKNPPFMGKTDAYFFSSKEGQLMFKDFDEGDPSSYFADTDMENRAFYGSFKVDVSFSALKRGGEFKAIVIYVDVSKKGKVVYSSPGKVVDLIEAMTGNKGIVHSYEQPPSDKIDTLSNWTGSSGGGPYIDDPVETAPGSDETTSVWRVFFVTREKWITNEDGTTTKAYDNELHKLIEVPQTDGGIALGRDAKPDNPPDKDPVEGVKNEGYTFGGWYHDEACTEPWNFETDKVTERTYVYAKWIPKYKLTFLGGEGAIGDGSSASGDVPFGTKIILPKNPFIKSGYNFTGWKLDGTETVYAVGAEFTMPGNAVTFTAQWLAIEEPPAEGAASAAAAIAAADNDLYYKANFLDRLEETQRYQFLHFVR